LEIAVSASAAAEDAEVALALDAAVATPCVAACCSVLQYVAAVATAVVVDEMLFPMPACGMNPCSNTS